MHETELALGQIFIGGCHTKTTHRYTRRLSMVCLHLGCGSLWTVTALLAQTFPLDPEPSQPGQQVRPRLCAAHPECSHSMTVCIIVLDPFSVKLLRTLRSSRLIAATRLLLPRHFAPEPYYRLAAATHHGL